MKKIVVFILVCMVASSCIGIGRVLVNADKDFVDVSEKVEVPVSQLPVNYFYSYKDEKETISDPYRVRVEFGVTSKNVDILTYDSKHPRFNYYFEFPCPILPTIKFNSFSFTDKNGDTIPCVLYYKTDDTLHMIRKRIIDSLYVETYRQVINIIDSFPIVFTNDIKYNAVFGIYAECSKSERELKEIVVNYDVEVGSKRYIKHVTYKKKTFFDFRPKIW